MKKLIILLCFIYILSSSLFARQAATPLFAFTPITPTTFQIANNSTAVVQYIVTNMSTRTHTLKMIPVSGVAQVISPGNCPSSFVLAAKQSCMLTLQVYGSQIRYPVFGGPKVCQQAPDGSPSPFECYQPSAANSLNITPQGGAQVPTFYVGTQSGYLYYSVNNGLTWIVLALPAGGSAINTIVVTSTAIYIGAANGNVYVSYNHGQTWAPITTPAPGFSVNGLFISANNKLYIASASGNVFICSLNGSNCLATTPPANGFAANGVFVTSSGLYVASANGNVYYSSNNGLTWIAINGQPDTTSVQTVYVTASAIYVGTASEYVYTSTSLTGGGTWGTPYAQTTYSLFVNPANGTLLAGTQGGYVYSLTTGNPLGFVTYSPINAISFFGG